MTVMKKGVLAFALVVAAIAAALFAWLAPRAKVASSPLAAGGTNWQARDYRLIADGGLDTAVVRIFLVDKSDPGKQALGYLAVDLETRRCRRLFKGFGRVHGAVLGTMHPAGHAVMGVRPWYQDALIRLQEEVRVRLLKERMRFGSELDVEMDARAEKFFYNPAKNVLVPFARHLEAAFVTAWRWRSGTDRLIVTEYPENGRSARSYLIDGGGEVVEELPVPAGLEVGRLGYFVVNKLRKKPPEIPSIVFVPWEGLVPVTIEAPAGHNIIGWSPDARHIVLAPKSQGYLRSYDAYRIMWPGAPIEVLMPFYERAGVDDSALEDRLPLTLWDRERDEKIALLDLSLRAPEGTISEGYGEFHMTRKGILAFIRREPGQAVRELCYYDFDRAEWGVIDLAITDPEAWIEVGAVSPDEESFLIRAPSHGLQLPSAPASAPQVSTTAMEERPVLVVQSPDRATALPLSVNPGVSCHLQYTLMADGTVLAVDGEDLVRYDPQTGSKETVVKDICGTWKSLGLAAGGESGG